MDFQNDMVTQADKIWKPDAFVYTDNATTKGTITFYINFSYYRPRISDRFDNFCEKVIA